MNNSDVKFFIEVFVTLFVIMDPPGTIPLFLSLTSGRTHRLRKRAAWQAVTVAFFVITVCALFGQSILDYLGITLAAMQGSGGLLLLLVALVPLGTPLLAGPGAIVATIVFVRAVNDTAMAIALALGIVAVHIVLWLFLRFSIVIIRVIKDSGVTLITRIAGLLLSAIAVQLIANSVTAFVKNA